MELVVLYGVLFSMTVVMLAPMFRDWRRVRSWPKQDRRRIEFDRKEIR